MTNDERPTVQISAYYACEFVNGEYVHLPEQATHVEATAVLPTLADAQEFIARFPKSLRLRATTLDRPIDGDYTKGSERVGYVRFFAKLDEDGVNGGRNEAGIKRYRSLLKHIAKQDVATSWPTLKVLNSYETREAFEQALEMS